MKYVVSYCSLLLLSLPAHADRFADAAPEVLSRYLQVDTVNPPGNETRAVKFLAAIFDKAGIAYETAESAPGRGNIWARLPGGDEPALVLLHHMDVVPADEEFWQVPPLSGDIKDGYVWGRGAVDMKGLGITQLQAFLALKASGKKLNRDVIYLATADEEAGGYFGAGWMVEHKPELFKNVGFLINEGGSGQQVGDKAVFKIQSTEKVPLWLRLTATDKPGHGSSPRATSAVNRILRAGNRIADTQFQRRLVPPVRDMLVESADLYQGKLAEQMKNVSESINDESFVSGLRLEEPGTAALLSNTCSITRLEGSSKINVVPPTASMELDCRLLPDQDPQMFILDLITIVNDPNIEIAKILGFSPAVSSTDTPLYRSLTKTIQKHFKGAKIIPSVSTGFTDSHFFRDLGIVSYGFAPFFFADNEETGIHGNDERISVKNMVNGTEVMIDFLTDFAVK